MSTYIEAKIFASFISMEFLSVVLIVRIPMQYLIRSIRSSYLLGRRSWLPLSTSQPLS